MGRRRRTRGLSEADRRLWEKVVADIAPIAPNAGGRPDGAPAPDAASGAASGEPDPSAPPQPPAAPATGPETAGRVAIPEDFRLGAAARPGQPARRAASHAPEGFDRRTRAAIARGRKPIDARLDLHGHTLAAAHLAVTGFIRAAHARGDRLVLIITGKGRQGEGALRRQVPVWLSSGPLAPLVVRIGEAHPTHGGAGALYVYLRRARRTP